MGEEVKKELASCNRHLGDALRARDEFLTRAQAAEAQVEALRAENADLKSSVITFCAPWAVTYARDHGLQPDQLFATHYDILERCGARMADFVRIGPPATLSAPAEERRAVHVDDINDPILKALANPEPGQCDYCLERDGKHAAGCDEAPAEEGAPGHTDLMVTPESMDAWFEKDAGARIICDFMNWPEDGPAWDDAHKLYAKLRAAASSSTPARGSQPAEDAQDRALLEARLVGLKPPQPYGGWIEEDFDGGE